MVVNKKGYVIYCNDSASQFWQKDSARILDRKTAYQTDVGMTGDYNSVIGYKKENPIHAFVKGFRAEGRFQPAEGEAEICGSFIESDDNAGFATLIEPFKF